MTHQKRLSAPKHYPIKRKENSYVATIKGSRSSDTAIPAVVFLRDVLEYADDEKEAKKIIRDGNLIRNGERVSDIQEGIGLLDVVEIPETGEFYRAVRKGEWLDFIPVEDGEKVAAKIIDKRKEGERFVYSLHNGENYSSKDNYGTGNTLVFNDSVKEVELEEGAEVLVIDGQHAGETAELKEINKRGMDDDTAKISEEEREFETETENIVAIADIEVSR